MKNINNYISETERLSSLDDYITEKFKLNSNNIHKYNYHPKNKEELKELIDKLIKERGYNANLNDIDVSEIIDMSKLFSHSKFNGDISEWDVSKVINMDSMFYDSKFNGDISEWDVGNVKDMKYMFCGCENFNSDISNWDISKVENLEYTFSHCHELECNFNKWNPNNSKDVINGIKTFYDSPKIKIPDWYKA